MRGPSKDPVSKNNGVANLLDLGRQLLQFPKDSSVAKWLNPDQYLLVWHGTFKLVIGSLSQTTTQGVYFVYSDLSAS